MIILKKFTNKNPLTEKDESFKFIALGDNDLHLIDFEIAQALCETKTIFAFSEVSSPYDIDIDGFKSDDHIGEISMNLIFDCALSFNDGDEAFRQFLMLLSLKDENKTQWDSSQVFDEAFSRYIPKIKSLLFDRLEEVSAHLAKKRQGDALISPEEGNVFKSILPSFLKTTYVDLTTDFDSSSQGEAQVKLSSAEKAYIKEEKKKDLAFNSKFNDGVRSTNEQKAKDGFRAAEVASQEANVRLDRDSLVAKYASDYGVNPTTVQELLKMYNSLDNVASILSKTKNACEEIGAKFLEILALVMEAKTFKEAEIKVEEILREFDKVKSFRDKFEAYGMETIDKARSEIDSFGGYAKAFSIWEAAVDIKKTSPSATYVQIQDIVLKGKNEGVEAMLKFYNSKDAKSKNKGVLVIIIIILFLIGAGSFAYMYYSSRESFSINIERGVASSLEGAFIKTFGSDYSYDGLGRYTATATKEDKLAFIDALEAKGCSIYPSPQNNVYIVKVPESSIDKSIKTKGIMLSVDSTAIRLDDDSLKAASAVFSRKLDSNVENIEIKESFESIKARLQNYDIDAQLKDGNLILNPIIQLYTIKPEGRDVATLLESLLKKYSIDFTKDASDYKCKLSNKELKLLKVGLQKDSLISEIKLLSPNVLSVFESTGSIYELEVYIDTNKDYSRSLSSLISSIDNISLEKTNLIKGGFDTYTVKFQINTKFKGEFLKAKIIEKSLASGLNLKARDFSITQL